MSEPPQPSPVYAPIVRQILDSSVWEADPKVRVLWITILIIAHEPGRNGTVDMTLRALAGRAYLTIEETRIALLVLSSPDPASRSKAHDGRRIALLDEDRDWGWRVLNWEVYEEARKRMFLAGRQARWRAKAKKATTERVKASSALRGVTSNLDRRGEDMKGKEKRERGNGGSGGTLSEVSLPESERPTLEQAADFFAAERLRGKPEKFVNWWAARGWSGIVDWRAAARTWSADEKAEVEPKEPAWNRPPAADEFEAEVERQREELRARQEAEGETPEDAPEC